MNKSERITIKTADLRDQLNAIEARIRARDSGAQAKPLRIVGGREIQPDELDALAAFQRTRLGWLEWANTHTVAQIKGRIADLRSQITSEEGAEREGDMRKVRPEVYPIICEIVLLEQAAGLKAVI